SLASQLNAARAEGMAALRVEQVERHGAGDPGPADILFAAGIVLAQCPERSLERVGACRVAVGEADREPIQQHVEGTGRPARFRYLASGLGHAAKQPFSGATTGLPGSHRLQIRLERERRLD